MDGAPSIDCTEGVRWFLLLLRIQLKNCHGWISALRERTLLCSKSCSAYVAELEYPNFFVYGSNVYSSQCLVQSHRQDNFEQISETLNIRRQINTPQIRHTASALSSTLPFDT